MKHFDFFIESTSLFKSDVFFKKQLSDEDFKKLCLAVKLSHPKIKLKNTDRDQGFAKFLTRSCFRPYPFGIFGAIATGQLSKNKTFSEKETKERIFARTIATDLKNIEDLMLYRDARRPIIDSTTATNIMSSSQAIYKIFAARFYWNSNHGHFYDRLRLLLGFLHKKNRLVSRKPLR